MNESHIAMLVEEVAKIVSGAPFPSKQSLAKARQVVEFLGNRAALTPREGYTLLGIPVVFDESVAPGTFELRTQKPKLIGWRMADYTYETADRAVARGWACKVSVLPIFEGDPNTGLAARPEVK